MARSKIELPEIVSRDKWLADRKKLLEKEKEHTRQRDKLNAERRRLPMAEIEKEYVFNGPDEELHLADLFEGRRQLIVYHFMFGPDWDEGCPSCSLLVDNIGHPSHFHARNTTLALVSRAPFDKIKTYKKRMGWTLPWYSSYGSDFNYDFHATLDPDVAPVEYNYQRREGVAGLKGKSMEGHGVSVFLRNNEKVYHTYSTYARGVDLLIGTYNWLDLTPMGRQEDWEEPSGRSDGPMMSWVRRHDQY